MTEVFERLSQLAEQALGKIKVSSALNSCLWLCAFVIPFGFVAAAFASGPLHIAGIVIAFIPIVLFSIGFLYFMIKSPEKLRSEEYELRKFALELVQEKGGRIAVATTSVEAISNLDYKDVGKTQIGGPNP